MKTVFNDKAYAELKASLFLKRFRIHCALGGIAFFLGGIALCVLGFVYVPKIPGCILILIGACCLLVPAGFLFSAHKKPYLCDYGTIKEKKDKSAVITVNNEQIKGTSFERFLFNRSLKDYKEGDQVIIYSAGKSNARPLFFHAKKEDTE